MKTPLIIATATSALALAACGGGDAEKPAAGAVKKPAAAAAGTTVNVKVFNFKPDPLTVKAGTKVTWVNQDSAVHTASAGTRTKPSKDFDGNLPESGGKFSYTFDKPGTYDYYCKLHSGPGMTASVIVE